jgi:periplasmic protein TonB
MSAAEAVPSMEGATTANDRLKDSFGSWFWGSMIAATVLHFGAFAFWPELTAEDFSYEAEVLESIELPPEIEIPPPPEAIARPATPVIAAADIDEDITIAPTTFEENPVEELPPPPEAAATDLSAQPTFTPFTVAPEIQNRSEVVRAMEREYPPLLRDAGIGGTVRVYFFIDEQGRVQDYRVDQSSGHQALDDAALAVASVYRFSPALNRDKQVPVWVSFPITFQVR